MRSLRSRILALTVGAAAAVLILLAVPVTLSTYRNAQDQAGLDAAVLAQGIADLISTGVADPENVAAVVDRTNGRRNDTPVTVSLADGTSIGAPLAECSASDDSGFVVNDDPPGDGDRGGGPDGDGGRDGGPPDDGPRDDSELRPIGISATKEVDGGTVVRIAVTAGDGDAAVCAYVADETVRADAAGRLAALGGTALLILAGVTGLSLLVARRLARDLSLTAATADRLSEGDLTARVPDAGPTEVRRVGAALNRLAGRIDELLVVERETVADLSHRLRTPLMAVRLDVEALPESSAKQELEDHVAHLERALTTVIQAARRPQREGASPSCDAALVVRARYDFWAPLLEDQGRQTSIDIGAEVLGRRVRCAGEDLAVALDALLENAVAHTAETTAVAVVVTAMDADLVQVDVRDAGPGVPDHLMQRGSSDRGSTGLGLDIARSCAEASGGRLELAALEGWSVVRLVLGSA